MKSEFEWKRMMTQQLYSPCKVGDDSWERVHAAQKKFNESEFWHDSSALDELKRCFGKAPENMALTPPVYFDHGDRVFFGEHFYANTGLTILDEHHVIFGDNVFLGPHVSIYTAGHPIDADTRNTEVEYAKPVTIGSDVWIGGNVVINPGVTIGSDVVIGSGSVVTKDIPDHMVAAGNPCKVIREITEEERNYWKEEYGKYISACRGRNGKMPDNNYKFIDKESYYRKGIFRHFSEDCKCSTSITARIDVTELAEYSRQTGTKFYLNFLYLLTKVLNSRDDYRMGYLRQTNELICYDVIHPTQYVFHEDTENFTLAYTSYHEDYSVFYACALEDLEQAKRTREYGLDARNHPNWFDASCIPWLSYDSLNIELPDGYLFFAPIINWGRYREENGRLMMPVSVRLNHAIADGYLIANVFRLLEREMEAFC